MIDGHEYKIWDGDLVLSVGEGDELIEENAGDCLLQISDFSFLFAPRKPAFTRLGAISQNNLTQLPAK